MQPGDVNVTPFATGSNILYIINTWIRLIAGKINGLIVSRRGASWFSINNNISTFPNYANINDLILNGGEAPVIISGVDTDNNNIAVELNIGDYVKIISLYPFNFTQVLGNIRGPAGPVINVVIDSVNYFYNEQQQYFRVPFGITQIYITACGGGGAGGVVRIEW